MDKQQVGKLAVIQEKMRSLWIRHVEVSNELKEVGSELVNCLQSIEEAQFIEGTYEVGWAQEANTIKTPSCDSRPKNPVRVKFETQVCDSRLTVKTETSRGRKCFECGKFGHVKAKCPRNLICEHCKGYGHRRSEAQSRRQ